MSDELHYYRAFPTAIERTGQHQLTGRLVPWDTPTQVADPTDTPDKWDIYKEGFRRGAFEPQIRAVKHAKISLVHRHGVQGLGFLGPFIALRDQPDGLYGDVKIVTTKRADVEDLLEAGVDQLSIEFRLIRRNDHTEVLDGVRWRRHCYLDAVALEPIGAYPDAKVLAYERSEADKEAQEQREREEAEAAERQRQADEEAAERERAEKLEAERQERRARWDEMTNRYDADVTKQGELVRAYGVTQH
jgi:HK97 family phage prohead protease